MLEFSFELTVQNPTKDDKPSTPDNLGTDNFYLLGNENRDSTTKALFRTRITLDLGNEHSPQTISSGKLQMEKTNSHSAKGPITARKLKSRKLNSPFYRLKGL